MLLGLGRYVRAVHQDPEKYRDIVLWACKRNIAYDAQCEGTRSWYVYTMASGNPDKTLFINAAAEALNQYCPNAGGNLPPLLHLYTLCSYCRESMVAYMARHRMLTEDILAECLYDSNYDILRYAEKRLNK